MQKASLLVSSSAQLKPPHNTMPPTIPAATGTLQDIEEGRLKNAHARGNLGARTARFSHGAPTAQPYEKCDPSPRALHPILRCSVQRYPGAEISTVQNCSPPGTLPAPGCAA